MFAEAHAGMYACDELRQVLRELLGDRSVRALILFLLFVLVQVANPGWVCIDLPFAEAW